MKVKMSVASSIFLLTGLPDPCPAFVSTRRNIGFFWKGEFLTECCKVAANFSEWRGLTRSSWSAVRIKVDGYSWLGFVGVCVLCRGEYLMRLLKCFSSSGFPKSEHHAEPIVNLWKRNMSKTPTWAIAQPNKLGCWLMQAPTKSPPFEPEINNDQNTKIWQIWDFTSLYGNLIFCCITVSN